MIAFGDRAPVQRLAAALGRYATRDRRWARHPSRLTPHGFTYIGLLILIALMGIALAGTGVIWHTETQREKERELLFVGGQYRKAIMLYYESTPGMSKRYPRSFQDLLKDDRYPGIRRYLRKFYRDPMTNKPEWGTIQAPDGGIMGVYSLSDANVFKLTNFRDPDADLEGKTRYSEWIFFYSPSPQMAPHGPQPPPPLAAESPK